MVGTWLIGGAAVLAAGAAGALAWTSEREATPRAAAVLAVVVGLSFVACGLVARRQRPANRLGAVMVLMGFAWFASFLGDAGHPLPFTIGTALEDAYLVGFVYLVLSFPGGRLERLVDRALFAAAVVLASVVEIGWLLFARPSAVFCDSCPANLLEVARNDALARALLDGQRGVGVALSVVTAVLLVGRWRRATPAQRRAAGPVLWAGSALFCALALSTTNDALGEPVGQAPAFVLSCVFAATPVAVLAVLVRGRLARGAVAGLVVELGEDPRMTDLRGALARTLGDPSLELAFWAPAAGRYVDAAGQAVRLPEPGEERATTLVHRAGEPIAALVHDPAVGEDAELVDSVCAAAALALENERLQADLRARMGELRASRARLVEAAESERRRIERDLHDGAQAQLVSLAMTLGLAETRLRGDDSPVAPLLREARETIASALADLREFSQGLHPGLLRERGLGPALEELARRAPIATTLELALEDEPAASAAAAGYFVASEALTNVAKHSHAGEAILRARCDGALLVVEVADDGIGGATDDRGSGLRGLADRVDALGGRLTVTSAPGRGTVVRAEIPCA